jgi:hypothetical protein
VTVAHNLSDLHRRAASGGVISETERRTLETWYAEEDRAEAALLASPRPDPALGTLQSQLDAAVQQLTQVSEQVKQAVTANETLRQDIAKLQRQLMRRTDRRAA